MIAPHPVPKTAASSPSPPQTSAPAQPGRLAEAEAAYQAKVARDRDDGRIISVHLRHDSWKKSNFPQLHRERAFELFEASGPWRDELERLIDRYVEVLDGDRAIDRVAAGVLFAMVGGRGGGKTQAATCIALYSETRGHRATYTTAQGLFRELRSTFGNRSKSEQALIDRYAVGQLLVIDELHDRAQTDFEVRTLNAIIDERYTSGKYTLLISNETAERFAESIGPSIASRFEEAGEITTVTWPSFRTR